MTIPFTCVIAAWLLIYLPKFAASIAVSRGGSYDNNNPRDQQAALTGWKRRATAAHLNAFENFAPFAAAVFVAHLGHASESLTAPLALVFVAARIAHPALYIADLASARSLAWGVGFVATFALFLSPLLR
ncbi:MAG TPA: MAPEG family protein [Polyangiaceae bacterium]|jgi:uncharacterized MAPEG superfamily protein|nr:MAPEG family protein [Polyangiaceae bacterium]